MKKILILWVNWMLWNCLFSYLQKNKNFLIYWTVRNKQKKENNIFNLDIDEKYLSNLENILNNNFDYVINCIAINNTINSDNINIIKNTFIVNSHLPKSLDDFSYKYFFKLIHISTNWVFEWTKWSYDINKIPDNLKIYWLSKYLGEFNSSKNLIIRTSIIWYEKRKKPNNLLNWFLSNKEWTSIEWYSNVFWNWLTTLTISKVIEKIIKDDLDISGIIHLSWKKISKFKLLSLFNKIFDTKLKIFDNKKIILDNTTIKTKEQKLFVNLIFSLEKQIYELKKFYNL